MKVAIFFIAIFVLFQTVEMCDKDSDCVVEDGLSRICRKKPGDVVGTCVFGCVTDGDCPLPLSVDPRSSSDKKFCSKGICVAGCRTDSRFGESIDCPDDMRCNTNFKVEGTDIGKCDDVCRSNEDCRLVDTTQVNGEPHIDTITLIQYHTFCIKQSGKKNFCSVCRTNADCVDRDTPICNLQDGECVSCSKDSECKSHPSGKFCKTTILNEFPTDKTCGCETSADCTGKQYGSICDPDAGLCTCNEDTDCKVKGFQKCSVNPKGVRVCGQCDIDRDCPQPPDGSLVICLKNFMFSKCVLYGCSSSSLGTRVMGPDRCGCRDDTDCVDTKNDPFTPACDCASGKCVACTKDAHCKSFERCNDAKKCTPLRCQSDFDCFRKDLIELGRERTEEARCSDSQKCVERVPVCIDSEVNLVET